MENTFTTQRETETGSTENPLRSLTSNIEVLRRIFTDWLGDERTNRLHRVGRSIQETDDRNPAYLPDQDQSYQENQKVANVMFMFLLLICFVLFSLTLVRRFRRVN